MAKSQSLLARTLAKFGKSQRGRRTSRRRVSRRLRTEALEARQLLAGDICINEIMADNDSTIEDPQEVGAFEDWVELYNPTAQSVDLSGKFLTDDVDAPTQWQFPSGSTIDAGGYFIIWADGDTDQGDTHASFKLSSGGETVALYDTDGTTLIDSIEFGAQLTDVSYGRSPDGGDTLGSFATATPGATNSTIVETNIDPTADAGGPYAGTTADTITLSGSDSDDSDGTIASYAWDFDGDGQYDDATGERVSFTSATVGIVVVGLQVTDDDGATATDTGTIVISEVGAEASSWNPVAIDDEAAAFFDDSYVHEIHITFEDDDWYNTLFTSHDTDVNDPYFEADFIADGIALEGVGVRFKGNSSFSGSGVKKSIKIDFNEFEDLEFLGLKKLNLNNNYNDPTMLREKLFYDFASNYVEGVGRAVFTNVFINGELYGIYTAVEQVDSTFTETRFGEDDDGNLYKGTASDNAVLDDPSADFGSDLTYLGTDQADYEQFYELKTNEAANDYSQLIEFIDVLNNTPSGELADAIEPLLDVQDTLASLALNNLFANLDSYSGAAHNYYLYDRDDTGQITHILWDANESFGTFTQFVDRFDDPLELDPFWLPESTGGRPGEPVDEELRPLAENLWAVDDYSIDYLRDLEQMLKDGFDVTSASVRINELADLIRNDIDADPNKQFTTEAFEFNLTSDGSSGNRTFYGLTNFIEERSTFLTSALSQYDLEPEFVEIYINEIMADNDVTIEDPDEAGAFEDWIELYNPGATEVDLSGFYLTDDAANPTQWEFPSGSTIDAGGYLVIWADGDIDQGDTHANFKLSASGESVLFYNNDGETLVDSVTFGEQTTDVSYGRFPDGSSSLTSLPAASPGATNTNNVIENVAPVADAGGPYTGIVGDAISLSGAASTDSDGTITSYEWDLDNDSQFETSGVSPDFSAVASGTLTVSLRVTDDSGSTDVATATVTVNATQTAGIVITQSGNSTVISESGLTDTIGVSLSSQPDADVIVTLTSNDTDEATASPNQLTFTIADWDVPQTVTISSSDDGQIDGSQNSTLTLAATSDDVAYDALSDAEVEVTTQDANGSNSATQIVTPDFVIGSHVIPGGSIPNAILFQATVDADISILAVGTSNTVQNVRMVDQDVATIGGYSEGVMTATVTAGQLYAIIFEANSESQTYSVQSTAGTDAFTPSVETNILQPTDTNGDSFTTALDALVVINELQRQQNGEEADTSTSFMYDVNNDGNTTALDALVVINKVSRDAAGLVEAELVPSATEQFAVAPSLNAAALTLASATVNDGSDAFLVETKVEHVAESSTSESISAELQSLAVTEWIEENRSLVSETDLNLLAENLQQVSGLS